MASEKASIENLDGTNYQSWKKDIQMILIRKGVWEFLGKIPDAGQEREWTRAQQLGLAEIYLACEHEQKKLISEAVDMTEAWEILARRHEAPSAANKMRLEQEFVSFRMSPNEPIEKFITKVKAKAQELRAVGVDITSARTSNIILAGLPQDYLPVVTAMTIRPGELRLEDVVDAVINHETALKRFNTSTPVLHHSPAITAMTAGGPIRSRQNYANQYRQTPYTNQYRQTPYANQYRQTSHNNRNGMTDAGEPVRCYYCGKLGHTQNVCFNKNPNLKPTWMKELERGPASATGANTSPMPRQNASSIVQQNPSAITPEEYSCDIQRATLAFDHAFATVHGHEQYSIERARLATQISREWLRDSGASSHCSANKDLFLFLEHIVETPVLTGNGWLMAIGKGTIPLVMTWQENGQQKRRNCLLENVLYIPMLASGCNLLSLKTWAREGIKSEITSDRMDFWKDGIYLGRASDCGNGWKLDIEQPTAREHPIALATCTEDTQTAETWHQRLGHLNKQDILRLPNKVTGMIIGTPKTESSLKCAGCLVGKQQRKGSRMPMLTATKRLERVHCDLSGRIQQKGGLDNAEYFVVFIDEFSRFTWLYPLKTKDESRGAFVAFKAYAERQCGSNLLVLHTDGEGSFQEAGFIGWLQSIGVILETTPPGCPDMNGLAERTIQTIVRMTTTMLYTAGIPGMFWPDAARTATYLRNRCPNASTGKTPYELWHDQKPSLGHLRIFGCRCYAHVQEKLRDGKLGARTVEAVFFGYYDADNVFAVFDVNAKKVIKRRDVVFHEEVLGHPSLRQFGLQPGYDILGNSIDESLDIAEQGEEGEEVILATFKPTLREITLASLLTHTIPEEPETNEVEVRVKKMTLDEHLSKSGEQDKMIQQFDDLFKRMAKEYQVESHPLDIRLAQEEILPKTFSQAMRSINKSFWFQALVAEMRALFEKGTFGLVSKSEIPPGRKPLATKWVFAIKRDITGSIIKFKARWVARGDLQKKGIDYRETFAPVISFPSLRIILTIAAKYDLEIGQFDVISAFLNGLIDTIVYLRQPDGFALDTRVCILHKSIYGLCQAAKSWYEILDIAFEAFGFKRIIHDSALWYKPSGCYALAHVDDCLVVGTNSEVREVKSFLATKFKIKDMGDVSIFTGLLIQRDRSKRTIQISQAHYAKQIIDTYGMQNCNPVLTPMEIKETVYNTGTCTQEDKTLFQRMVGSLLYLANGTRPDISYAVTRLAQFASNPSEQHMIAIKRVLRYIKGTVEATLLLATSDSNLIGYFDSSWLDNPSDRRSTYGLAIMWNGSPLLWKSKRHTMITMSTCESEYLAGTELIRELSWIRNILVGLQQPPTLPITVYGDNENANGIATTGVQHRTRHIEAMHYYITEKVQDGMIVVKYLPTKDMIPDMFTKPMPRDTIYRHAKALGVYYPTPQHICSICNNDYSSHNLLHKHLRDVHGYNKGMNI